MKENKNNGFQGKALGQVAGGNVDDLEKARYLAEQADRLSEEADRKYKNGEIDSYAYEMYWEQITNLDMAATEYFMRDMEETISKFKT